MYYRDKKNVFKGDSMRKNKSMACVLAALMIVQQPASCEVHHVIHENRINVLDAVLSGFLGAVSFLLGVELVNYFKSRSASVASLFEFIDKENLTDTFATVIGNDEAKKNFQEIISYLHNPALFLAHGLKAPRGVLLYGEPGNGKTMLARAVAKEAGCNFIAVGASELDDKFVGEGVKNLA